MKNDNTEKSKATKKKTTVKSTAKENENKKNTVEEIKIEEEVKIDNQINKEISYNNDTKSTIYLGFYSRYIIHFLFFIIALGLFVFFFINGIRFKVNYKLDYDIKSDVNYQVNLKENDYYKEKYLKEDMQYITDLIDNIDINLNYKMNTSEESNYNYNYNIKADIIITDRNDANKVLYKDTEVLKDDVVVKDFKNKNAYVLENLKIDYSKYNKLVNSFKSKYTLSASSNLIITMHVDTIINNDNVDKDIIDSEDLTVTIPLSEQTINILKDYNKEGKSGEISKYSYVKIVNNFYAIISILALLLTVIALIILFNFIKKFYRSNSLYSKKLHKIMKEYDRIIVTLSKMPNLDEYKIIEVESFEELLDAKQNLDKPILHIEIHKNQKSCFLILSGNEAYRYILKEVDLHNEKKY